MFSVVSKTIATSTDMEPVKYVSLGIIAWNEEKAITPMLESLFQQSFFAELSRRKLACEVICVTNGCTDRTPELAREAFARELKLHPYAGSFSCRVVTIPQQGKINAWNQFVHAVSAREARFLFLMDADILIHNRDTLRNMLLTLETNAEASISVDRPCKDLEFRPRKSLWQRMSLATSQLTRSSEAQLCGQLYCIRAEIARNIYLPKDLAACDDGFIKTLVCTDFLAHQVWPMRIQRARNAAHTFEAYTSIPSIIKNQKRQMIGQTIVHILVDQHLRKLRPLQRSKLAETLRQKELEDPEWLKKLVANHLRSTRFFWKLYPGLLSHRFTRLARLSPWKRITCLPAALAGFGVTLLSCFAASRFLKAGYTNYWPRPDRTGFQGYSSGPKPIPQFTPLNAQQE
jgi:glycosyltransferase involved in cell wall biosynthesis